jgi:hypothetical protein
MMWSYSSAGARRRPRSAASKVWRRSVALIVFSFPGRSEPFADHACGDRARPAVALAEDLAVVVVPERRAPLALLEGEVEAIEALFDEEGVRSVVSARTARRSAGLLPWSVLIVAPAGVFLTTLAQRAAGDAYEPLKRLVSRVFELRRRPDRPDGAIELDENGRTVILTDKNPDEGLRQLTAGKLPGTGYFVWDEKEGGWRRF